MDNAQAGPAGIAETVPLATRRIYCVPGRWEQDGCGAGKPG